jgi:hypothetical protein
VNYSGGGNTDIYGLVLQLAYNSPPAIHSPLPMQLTQNIGCYNSATVPGLRFRRKLFVLCKL